MRTKIVYSEKCLGYGTWHIEGPQRVKAAHDILQAKGYEFMEPTPACDEDILGIHDADYIFNVKKGLVEDSDTPAYKNIFEFAMLSVGGALLASKINGFSLTRPPGHHVGRTGAALGVYTRGFCYLNNIAIAVKESRKRTLITQLPRNRLIHRGQLHKLRVAGGFGRKTLLGNTRQSHGSVGFSQV
jgi:acetoin utilization deacetylase AcuC-like enzyme